MMEKSAAREVTKELLRAVNFRGVISGKLPMTPREFFHDPNQDLEGLCHVLLRPEFFTKKEMMEYCAQLLDRAIHYCMQDSHSVDNEVFHAIQDACYGLKKGDLHDSHLDRLRELQDDQIDRCWDMGTSRHSTEWHLLEAAVKASLHPFSPYSARNCTRVLLQFFHRDDDALASLREVLRWRVEGERGESSSS